MLAGADFVQAAADKGPADAPDGERDFADCHDVPDGQFPGRFRRVASRMPCSLSCPGYGACSPLCRCPLPGRQAAAWARGGRGGGRSFMVTGLILGVAVGQCAGSGEGVLGLYRCG